MADGGVSQMRLIIAWLSSALPVPPILRSVLLLQIPYLVMGLRVEVVSELY